MTRTAAALTVRRQALAEIEQALRALESATIAWRGAAILYREASGGKVDIGPEHDGPALAALLTGRAPAATRLIGKNPIPDANSPFWNFRGAEQHDSLLLLAPLEPS